MSLSLAWRKAALINGFKDATAYKWEFIIEIGSSAMVPAVIQYVIWNAVFRVGGASTLAGMTFEQMVAYTLVSMLFSQIRGGNHDFELQEMIRSGALSQYLLKPVGVVEFFYLRGVAGRLLNLVICLSLGITVGSWYGLSPVRMVIAMGLALLGNVLHYQIGAILSTAAFLWEEAFSILMVKNMAVSFLSGELIPLTLFPMGWEWIYKVTPFYLYVFGPVQYVLGKWTDAQMWDAYCTGFLWLIGLWGGIRLSWSLGLKRYSSLGG
jgi:ABC-2 type transport system permease protein